MRIPGFGDGAARLFCAAGMLGRHQAHEGHRPWRRGKTPGVAEFGGDGQRGEVINPAETAESVDARLQRLEGEQLTQVLFDRPEARERSSTARRDARCV